MTIESPKADGKSKRPHWLTITVPLACVLLGAFLTYLFTQYNGRLRILPYIVTATPNIVTPPTIIGKEVKVLIDNKPVVGVSGSHFTLFNNTDQNYGPLTVMPSR